MATISIDITATDQDFITFANELGYQDIVSKSAKEIEALPRPISIQDTVKPNPQSRNDFLLAYFKRITVDELSRVKITNIQKQVDTAKEAEKTAMRIAVDSAVSVTLT